MSDVKEDELSENINMNPKDPKDSRIKINESISTGWHRAINFNIIEILFFSS